MTVIQTKKTDYEVIPAGSYPGVFKGIEEKTNDKGPYYLWRFEVTGKSGKTADVIGMSGTSFGPKAAAFGWMGVLRGAPIEPGEGIDIDSLVGHDCIVVVTTEPRSDGQGDRNKIVALQPRHKTAAMDDEEPF